MRHRITGPQDRQAGEARTSAAASAALATGLLRPHHFAQLVEGSRISPDVVAERGYRSSSDGTALWIPVYPPGEGKYALIVARPDVPRVPDRKYEWPYGVKKRLDAPPRCHPVLGDVSVPLWIVEGIKKADALASRGACAISVDGVDCFGWRAPGNHPILGDWEFVALVGREVRITYDSDTWEKDGVLRALRRVTVFLERRGAGVKWVKLSGEGGVGHA